MPEFSAYTKIGQYYQVVKDVRMDAAYHNTELPTLHFAGTIKTHGTNAGFMESADGVMWVQSRKNIITIDKDNAGCAAWCEGRKDSFSSMIKQVRAKIDDYTSTIGIFFEFVGKGIQAGVGVSQVEKTAIIFDVKVINGENYYLEDSSYISDHEQRIYNTHDFCVYGRPVDFNNPGESRNAFIEMVSEVEKECPVAKELGVVGIGEGIVWRHVDGKHRYMFKTKGEKHSSSKVKVLIPVDPVKLANVKAFVEHTVTQNRLEQGMQQVFETEDPDMKMMGVFIKWVHTDIANEEALTLSESGLCMKDVGKSMSDTIRKWFIDRINSEL